MDINRNNYEIFFLDYWEKQLSPGEVADLMLFLEQNPDLKEEFDGFENVSILPEENIIFEQKENIKRQEVSSIKEIGAENYQNYFISSIEGQLDESEESDLAQFLEKNSFLAKEYEYFKQTILKPDNSITYPDKSIIKHYD